MYRHDSSAASRSALDTETGVIVELASLLATDETLRLIVATDYDGTLVPIVSDPSTARLSPAVKILLESLASLKNVHVMVSSGRSREALDTLAALTPTSPRTTGWGGLALSTSHGFVVVGKFGSLDKAISVAPAIAAAKAELHRALSDDPTSFEGVVLEQAEALVTIHYRNADRDALPALEHLVDVAAASHRLEKRSAILAFELRGRDSDGGVWHKGSALNWVIARVAGEELLQSTTPASPPPIALLVIGDDLTDEDMFSAAQSALDDGEVAAAWTIRVVNEDERATRARLLIDSPASVAKLLADVLKVMTTKGGEEKPIIPA